MAQKQGVNPPVAPFLPYTTANTSGQTKDTIKQSTCFIGSFYSFVGYHSWANLDIGPTQYKHKKKEECRRHYTPLHGTYSLKFECNLAPWWCAVTQFECKF